MSTETPPPAASEPTGNAGRYQRSFLGLVVSMVLTVLAIGSVLWFTGLFRQSTTVEPEHVDYLEIVGAAQSADKEVVYPTSIPKGWFATGVDVEPDQPKTFGLRFLTDKGRFVGVRLERASVTGLVHRWVDKDATEIDDYEVPATIEEPFVRRWRGFEDDGGDTAYAADLGKTAVIVFGSAPAAELQAIVDVLDDGPVG